jgi:hypothetical protein
MSQDGADDRSEIIWVGQQHLMSGFCGRVSHAPAPGEQRQPAQQEPPTLEMRPIAVVRTRPRQARVVRIGPPRMAAAENAKHA